MNYSQIMIFGRPGSGKSTFALKLSKNKGLPLYHLDKYFYEDNWKERDYNEFLEIQQSLVNQDKWIIDGNSTKSFEMRYSKADLAIYFNYPKAICYWRIFKRLFCKDKQIDDRATGCKETVRWSLLKYMWSFEERVANQLTELKRKYPNCRFIEVTKDEDLGGFYDYYSQC
jgi:adenylate kinase family enzyme